MAPNEEQLISPDAPYARQKWPHAPSLTTNHRACASFNVDTVLSPSVVLSV
jgi:hypothetical protein